MIYEKPEMQIVILDDTVCTTLVGGSDTQDPSGELEY